MSRTFLRPVNNSRPYALPSPFAPWQLHAHRLLMLCVLSYVTMLNGDFWILETQYEAEILMQLKNQGLEALKRDDLFFYRIPVFSVAH